jgi:hypothetical protein
MTRLLLALALLLPACADLRAARHGCALDDVIEVSAVVLDVNALDDGCGPDPRLRFATVGPGSVELDGCAHVEEPERFDCGIAYHFVCPAGPLDSVGTPGTWEVSGHIEVAGLRDGPVGFADVTLWAAHGTDDAWPVCSYQAEADAWPVE